MKHDGTLDDLQTIINGCGFHISEVKNQENCHQIKTGEGAIVNWHPSTGTVNIQGKKQGKNRLTQAWGTYTGSHAAVSDLTAEAPAPESPPNNWPKRPAPQYFEKFCNVEF
jgi:hypothetical protein